MHLTVAGILAVLCTASAFVRHDFHATRFNRIQAVMMKPIEEMKASDIKAELDLRKVGYAHVYEKEDLVRLLAEARASGKADPSIIDEFNKQNLEKGMDTSAEGDSKIDIDDLDLDSMVADDGTLPGGLTPEQMKQLISDPEIMGLMKDPKFQGVMKTVMEEGPTAMMKFMGDPEAMQSIMKLATAMQKVGIGPQPPQP